MANKTTPKKLKMGYELRINPSGQSGEANWVRVGGLFQTTQAAAEYKKKKHPNTPKHVILGVNVTAVDKLQARFFCGNDKTETKKGFNNASK